MSETQEGKKRNRKRYGGPRNKKSKGSRELEVGMQGILITCNMNERKCTSEAYSVLNEYADTLFGPETFVDDGESHSEEEEEEDAEAALKKEVTQIKSSTRQRRFTALDSGANNVVFIRTHNIDPEKLVHHILEDLHETKKKKSRVMLRMLPVSATCRAFPEDMEKFMSSFLEPWFKAPQQASYQISFKARNNSHSNRDDVIKALAGLVGKMNPKNKVDLTKPKLTIIVEVIKTVCCVSVVRDYMLFRKYNLQEVTKGSPNLEQGPQEVTKGPPNQEQGRQEVTEGPLTQEQGPEEVVKSEANPTAEEGPTESGRSEGEMMAVAQGNGSKEVEQQ